MSNNPTPQEVKDLFRPIIREYNFSTMIRTIIFWALPVAMLAFIAMWYFQVPLMWYFQVPLMTFGLSLGLAYMSLGFFVLVVGLVLYFAADRQFKEWLRNYNYSQEFNEHILHAACLRGNRKILGLLLEAKVDVNQKNKDSHTALHFACEADYDRCSKFAPHILRENIVGLLLEAKVDVNQKNKDGDTALHFACEADYDLGVKGFDWWGCRARREDIVNLLLGVQGINPNLQNQDGDTALHVACREGRLDSVQMLLEAKVDVNLQNQDGDTALHFACKADIDLGVKGFDWWACRARREDIVNSLLGVQGINPNLQNQDGDTALHVACREGRLDSVQMLLEAGADPTITNNDSKLPEHVVRLYIVDLDKTFIEAILKALAEASNKRPAQPLKAAHAEDPRRNQGGDAKVPAAGTGGSALPADEKIQSSALKDRGVKSDLIEREHASRQAFDLKSGIEGVVGAQHVVR